MSVYVVLVMPVATGVAFSPPDVVPRYTLYPVIAEPPLDDGAVHDSVTCELPDVAVNPAGDPGTVDTVSVFISIAASSQKSAGLAVQPHMTAPGDGTSVELDAPVIALGMLTFHCCV